VDDAGRTRLSPISCSAVQWLQEDLQVAIGTRREDLESSLTQRIRALTQGLKAALLVSWSIRGTGPLLGELRRGKLRGELLDWLRIEYGLSPPVVWSVDLEGEPGGPLPASLYEQETILGDFLRALRQHEADPQLPLNVEDLLADGKVDEALARSAALADGPARRRVLREAALLGLELLGGEPAEPA
jgi:hypothetical protein